MQAAIFIKCPLFKAAVLLETIAWGLPNKIKEIMKVPVWENLILVLVFNVIDEKRQGRSTQTEGQSDVVV